MASMVQQVCRPAWQIVKPSCFTSLLNKPLLLSHGQRTYFTEPQLGVTQFRKWKEHRQHILESRRDGIITVIKDKITNDKMILSEELDNLVAITNDTADLDLLGDAVKKYNKRKDVPGNFHFGPTVIMAHYLQNQADKALALLGDTEVEGFFRESRSFSVVMQMLYDSERYQEVIDVFTKNHDREVAEGGGLGFPTMPVSLCLASCFKLNTDESLNRSLMLIKEMQDAGTIIQPRQRSLVGALALRHGQFDVAYEVCGPWSMRELQPSRMGIAARSIQIISLSKMGREREALDLLSKYHRIITRDGPLYVLAECAESLEEAIEKSGSEDLKDTFTVLNKKMVDEGRYIADPLDVSVTVPKTFHQQSSRRRRDIGFGGRGGGYGGRDGGYEGRDGGSGERGGGEERNIWDKNIVEGGEGEGGRGGAGGGRSRFRKLLEEEEAEVGVEK